MELLAVEERCQGGGGEERACGYGERFFRRGRACEGTEGGTGHWYAVASATLARCSSEGRNMTYRRRCRGQEKGGRRLGGLTQRPRLDEAPPAHRTRGPWRAAGRRPGKERKGMGGTLAGTATIAGIVCGVCGHSGSLGVRDLAT
jgi:hypothetical protein